MKSDSEKVVQADLQKMRDEIRVEVAAQFAASMGELIVQKVLDRMSERAGNVQRAEAAAIAARDEAQKQAGLFEDRRVRLEAQIKELSTAYHEKQAAFEKLSGEYDSLLPRVVELRKEHASHVDRVKRIAG
jgi:chromosome segregation ATPase